MFCPDSEAFASSNTWLGLLKHNFNSRIPLQHQFSSVAQSWLTLRPHEPQHARPPFPSPTPGVLCNMGNAKTMSAQWLHKNITKHKTPPKESCHGEFSLTISPFLLESLSKLFCPFSYPKMFLLVFPFQVIPACKSMPNWHQCQYYQVFTAFAQVFISSVSLSQKVIDSWS